MGGYRDLEIYNLSFRLSLKVHQLSKELPAYERMEIGRQIRKSSKSICSNIVEGYGRKRYRGDFIKFLTYANASCDETVSHLFLIKAIHFNQPLLTFLMDEYEVLGRKIYTFLKSVERY